MRHVVFGAVIALYIVVIGQSWAVYTAAVLLALWVRQRGRLNSIPFTIGGAGLEADVAMESAPPETSGT